ncbi:condensin-2 complex subunit G2-like isoform X2 [Xenia sp. Carnegie-2017]|uniref:condensin-2 complex subunit G2-like isoform X2 n=1 Tax=Xenia sp. Carnegie-2017 TaxID=2897299 RepID=UPI001F048328|nr:condensin-2 complex subunit G2-like isoform X2 [Xenia sp. Carnegie-2017]
MATRREEILKTIHEHKQQEFIALIKLHHSKNDPFDLCEMLQSLSQQEYEEMWSSLSKTCQQILTSFDMADEGFNKSKDVLAGITTIALCSINLKECNIIGPLIQVTVMLQGILLELPDDCAKLQFAIAHLCEMWFQKNLEGKDKLVTTMLPYFILKALCEGLIVDVKRLWSLRQTLLLMDLEDELSASSLKSALLQCIAHPVFLKIEEGRKFLSYLFGLHLSFMEEIHKTIKKEIPMCNISTLIVYGEIYFKAWRASKEVYREKIERFCLQDLMFHSIHAQRIGRHSMSSRLRKILGVFHKQKQNPDVDKILLELYSPIIWRACKVANPNVRANAAAIFFDVFPLNDSTDNIARYNELLQRQFDVIVTFLDDPFPTVRSTAVHGVFNILSLYWEVIPAHVVKELLFKVFQTSAFDVSSSSVRAAVFEGLTYVLDNRLCHPLIKTFLPGLKNLLHDNSEQVRVAFLDFLLKVKGMRSIKFWSITPMDHLLARLEVEQSTLVLQKIIKLLMNSFHPVNKDSNSLLVRCVQLWELNPKASRKFYQYIHHQISVTSSVQFLMMICKYLDEHLSENHLTYNDIDHNDSHEEVNKENSNNSSIEMDKVDEHDKTIVAGLLETCIIIWEGIDDELEKPSYDTLKSNLHQQFAKAIPKMIRSIEDSRCQSCLILLASHLSPTLVPSLRHRCLTSLSSLPEKTSCDVYGPLLELACSFNLAKDVIQFINENLHSALQETSLEASPRCRLHVLPFRDELLILRQTLKESMGSIDQYISINSTCEHTNEKRNFLMKVLYGYCRLSVHLYASEVDNGKVINDNDDLSTCCEDVVKWCQTHLLHYFDNDQSVDSKNAHLRKHHLKEFLILILRELHIIFAELVVIGLSQPKLNILLANFSSSVLSKGGTLVLLPDVCKLLYQIVSAINYSEEIFITDWDPVYIMLGSIFKAYVSRDHSEKQICFDTLYVVVMEIFKLLHGNESNVVMDARVVVLKLVVETLLEDLELSLNEITHTYQKDHFEILPPLSNFLINIVVTSKQFVLSIFETMMSFISSTNHNDVVLKTTSYAAWIFLQKLNDESFESMKTYVEKIGTALETLEVVYNPENVRFARHFLAKCSNITENVNS